MAQQPKTSSPTQEQGAGTAGDNEQDDDAKKMWNRMDAKLRRLCNRTSTGKLQVSEEIHQLWLKSGATRDSMVQTLIDCNGEKDFTMIVIHTVGDATP